MSQFYEIKETEMIFKKDAIFEHREVGRQTMMAFKDIFENLVEELWTKKKDVEGELEISEDDLYDVLHLVIDSYLSDDEQVCDLIIAECGGINHCISEFVDDMGWESINRGNVSGCLAYKQLYDRLVDINHNHKLHECVKGYADNEITKFRWE